MSALHSNHIEMIPISRISVLNPRARNKRQHRDIVNNIEAIGLKRPITVSRHNGPSGPRYDLVCGEGRLEAFQMLGQSEIPAVVIEASEDKCLVMSLVENIARRTPRPIDLMREIGALRARGYTDAAIAKRIGVGAQWVYMIAALLEKGEERLVAAVETGLIPITLAMEISRAETEEAQSLLLDAYEAGQLRGKKLAAVRRVDAWNELSVLQHAPWLGRLLAASILRQSGVTTGTNLAAINLGLKTVPVDRRRHRDREIRLLAIAHGLLATAEIGLKEHDRLALARTLFQRKLDGRRTSSKLPKLVELVMAKPLVSAGMVAKTLDVTPQAARRIVLELGLREMTGRGRFRAWGVI